MWPTLHCAWTGRRLGLCIRWMEMVVMHQHHSVIVAAQHLIDVGVNVVVVAVVAIRRLLLTSHTVNNKFHYFCQ